MVLWLPGPRTETGEDMAELHLHGGRAVVAAVLGALGRIEGFRPAEPGEFARRSFANGRIGLTEVEGLADLIFAETEAQRRQAWQQLGGALGNAADEWRRQVTEALALVEAGIDFADEADVPTDLVRPALATAGTVQVAINAALAGAGRGERLREGLVVAIAGPPNAGKSSLLNRISGREAAIVSPFAGTTRDVIEVHLDLEGYPVTLLDTAGIRESDDPVEQEGVRRARARAATADLVLWVVDAADPVTSATKGEGTEVPTTPLWLVRNKIDLLTDDTGIEPSFDAMSFAISARTGEGLDTLLAGLTTHAECFFGAAESALVTRERHRHALTATAAALGRALAEGEEGREDILAEELRAAARALGRLTGRIDVDDILDVIFRDFCIGK
jgi:tRNA modification GTPase